MVKINNPLDTITAQATPPGRGGVAIIRISGSLVTNIMNALFKRPLASRTATHAAFYDAQGNTIDEGIALFFPNPHSFTGEDVLELQSHGSPIVVDLLLARLMELGVRLARPGEFSERAFLNGKLDLTQAEAIADLIDASSAHAARLAVRSLQGEFSKAIHALNEKVIHLRMYIEAAMDFVDEEIDFLSNEKISQALQEVIDTLVMTQKHAKQGSFLREGITAVIAGKPNVGKSSLLNRLSGKDVAIVTNIPGTTRDVLRDYILIDDIPMHIVDTAGLRDSDDVVEQEGIRRAHIEMEKADIILYVMDQIQNEFDSVLNYPLKKTIFIVNKIDLLSQPASIHEEACHTIISLSAKTGEGIDLLKQHIKACVGFDHQEEGIFLARRRHLDALAKAQAYVEAALNQLKQSHPSELAAEELRLAQQALNEITGEFTADDLLGRIFSSFCIGK